MPSGSKKRKAAKKKKEKEAHTTNNSNNSSSLNNNNNNNPHENDHPRSQDERDSDGGEVGSPASMDHNNQTHPFHEGNGESGKKDPSLVQSVVGANKSLEEVTADAESGQKVGLEDDGIVKTEEFKSKEDSESKSVSVEHFEFAKESHHRYNGSSNSSSLVDESRVLTKKLEEKAFNSDLEETLHHNEPKSKDSLSEEVTQVTDNTPYVETDDNIVVEPASVVDEVRSVFPVSEEVVEVAESASVENSVVSDVVGSVLKENVEKLLPTSDESSGVSLAATDVGTKENDENKVFLLSDEIVGASLNVAGSAINGNEGKILTSSHTPIALTDVVPKENNEVKVFPVSDENVGEVTQVTDNSPYVETDDNLVVEPASVVDEVRSVLPVSEEVVEVAESASVENSVVSDVVGSVLKENVEKLLPTSDESSGVLLAATDVLSKENNENKVFLLSDDIVGVSSNVAGSAINGNDGKILMSSHAPIASTNVVPKENNEVKVFPVTNENVGASSNVIGSAINGNQGIILTSSGAPIAGTSNGAENIKDPVIPECSENEPLVASAPPMVQRTSWLSCCGLFDVITGSS